VPGAPDMIEFEHYIMTVRSMDSGNIEKLSKNLMGIPSIVEFDISMGGD
jgi:hypothetical protein